MHSYCECALFIQYIGICNTYCCHLCVYLSQGDEVVLQSTFTSQEEHVKLCLAAEGFGSRLCRLEPTSNCKVKKSCAQSCKTGFLSICLSTWSINECPLIVTICHSMVSKSVIHSFLQVSGLVCLWLTYCLFPPQFGLPSFQFSVVLVNASSTVGLFGGRGPMWSYLNDTSCLSVSNRMSHQTCLYVALSWPSVSLSEPCRKCWPTARTWL